MATPAPTPKAKFLAAHPVFAAANAAGRKTWLTNHPNWAKDWATATAPPPAPGKATIGAGNPANQPDRTGTPWVPAPTTVPITPPANLSPPAGRDTSGDASAKADIAGFLAPFGLASLADWAWGKHLEGWTDQQIKNDIPNQPAYTQKYPGMAALSAAGHVITEGQYRDLEDAYTASLKAYGLPSTFYDSHDDFTKAITGQLSPKEFDDRLAMHQKAALTDPRGALLRSELVRMGYPGDPMGASLAFWIDPDKAQTVITSQFAAASAGASSLQTGFGQLSVAQAESIGNQGLSEGAVTDQFGQLAALKPLTQALPGEVAGTATSDADLLAMGFSGDAEAKRRVARTAENRAAAFRQGGSYATTSGGVSGLGTSGA